MSILIDENTTFIIQGITGREAVNKTRGPQSVRAEPVEARLEPRQCPSLLLPPSFFLC
jgi:hypothetical protein